MPGEQLDEWERELQHYEATLEEMATASLDMKEELGAVEQWFRVLTEAERTAALYSLLQQATQVQIRFFWTVLQQMASKTPVNHLLSPASFEKGCSLTPFCILIALIIPTPALSRSHHYANIIDFRCYATKT